MKYLKPLVCCFVVLLFSAGSVFASSSYVIGKVTINVSRGNTFSSLGRGGIGLSSSGVESTKYASCESTFGEKLAGFKSGAKSASVDPLIFQKNGKYCSYLVQYKLLRKRTSWAHVVFSEGKNTITLKKDGKFITTGTIVNVNNESSQ